TREGAFSQLEEHFAIVPGKPDESALVERISSEDEFTRMPPPESGKELSKTEIELLTRWIKEGAEYEDHWAFLPPEKPAVPEVEHSEYVANDIDRFIVRDIEAAKLSPSPEADRATLIRRLTFDLVGLPPTPGEVADFVNDKSPDAYEKVVDRLLNSPHYGERMAMYWLDLVRYADTVGYHGDQEHHTTLYRDYVIKSFNDNKPFDQFTIEQLAGDLLPDRTTEQLLATGYNRILQTSHEGGVQQKEYLAKYSADRVRNFSEVWLAGTMGCCECHDHKFDPFSQKDFYSLAAFFADINDIDTFKSPNSSPTRRSPEIDALSPIDQERIDAIDKELKDLNRLMEAADLTKEASEGIQKKIEALKNEREELENNVRKQMITVSVEPRPIRLLNRGDWMDDSGPVMKPEVPDFLPDLDVEGKPSRVELARWLVDGNNPLTARVFVNRLWYLYFGEGLARSLGDFGSQGEWPTHSALLDWLAVDFSEHGWDIKRAVKQIVMSKTYRQSSLVSPELRQADPANRLFARQGRYRLSAEMIRDQALAVSGLLVDRIGGPSARPYQPAGYYAHLNFPKRSYLSHSDENQYRRGVYVHWQRQYLHPMLRAFDAPTREECTVKRPISNTPSAVLTLLNDPTFLEAARVLAVRVLEQDELDDKAKLSWLWSEVLSREPLEEELRVLIDYLFVGLKEYSADPKSAEELLSVGLAPLPDKIPHSELAAWTTVCRAMLNLSESITRN
ncbi:MAG TPA: PSD1 and planctomycete cytochrome C domain-containing protein, partial [Planctomycetaceae bacterium]|nr:PSD1 and planctomycete cytochrome C domain-containing protein [Planctomycetaceae bacterium]